MKVLAMTIAAGVTLCSVMAVPASAIPMSDLAAAASGLALEQSVRSTRHYQRYRVRGSGDYYGYGGNCSGYGYGPNSPCYP
jgi:hypothetical protein